MDECPVCICSYTKRDRKKVTCPKCEYSACSTCYQQFIINSINEAHCMNCNNSWDRKFMTDNFVYRFVNEDYRRLQENLTMEREKANMQGAYDILERFRKADELENEIPQVSQDIVSINDQIRKLVRERGLIETRRYQLKHRIDNLRQGLPDEMGEEDPHYKVKFFGHCPREDCRGIVTEKVRCNVCNQRVCKSCKEAVGENEDDLKTHSCNPDTLESLKQIKKDSRPCPKCKVYIFRIEGCSMMFCTNCNITFSWTTGEIYRGGDIHNPHYFEWLQNGGRLIDENQVCGDNTNNIIMTRFIRKYSNRAPQYMDYSIYISSIIFKVGHIDGYILNNLREKIDNNERVVTRIKVDYLMNKMTEEEFKRKLQNTKFSFQRNREKYNILSGFVTGFCYCLRQIDKEFEDNKPYNIRKIYNRLKNDMDDLIKFTEELNQSFRKKFKTSFYRIIWEPQNTNVIEVFSVNK